MKVLLAAATLLLMLAACVSNGETDADLTITSATPTTATVLPTSTSAVAPASSTPTTSSTTSSSTSPPTSQAPTITTTSTVAAPVVLPWLTVDGFAGLEFGSATMTDVLGIVTPELGSPIGAPGLRCGITRIGGLLDGSLDFLRWDGLFLYFDEDVLVGWGYDGGKGLATPSGVAPYQTDVADLYATYGDMGLHVVTHEQEVIEESAGGAFVYVLSTSEGPAYLSGAITVDTVTSLSAGKTCGGPAPMYVSPGSVAQAFWDSYFASGAGPFRIATPDAVAWIEENGDRDQLDRSTNGGLLYVAENTSSEPCVLVGDVTFECILLRTYLDPASGEWAHYPKDLVIYVQDIARPGPDPEAIWLGAYIVVGVDFYDRAP